jgi:hypothetical protein
VHDNGGAAVAVAVPADGATLQTYRDAAQRAQQLALEKVVNELVAGGIVQLDADATAL